MKKSSLTIVTSLTTSTCIIVFMNGIVQVQKEAVGRNLSCPYIISKAGIDFYASKDYVDATHGVTGFADSGI